MAAILLRIAIRLALCAAAVWAAYRIFGVFAFVFAAPLLGVALARPIIDLVAEAHHSGKTIALQDLQGRYWSHRGHPIDIAADDDDARWLLLTDVRKVLPGLARDEVLRRRFGERIAPIGPEPGLRIRADALAEYLLKSTDTASLKFKVWLDRIVLGGSQNPRLHLLGNEEPR